jgi:hypothetical protein
VYEQANHGDKSGVAFKVVQTIARACPSGRFVEKDSQGTMKSVSPERAIRFICNALKYKNRRKREKSLLVAEEVREEDDSSFEEDGMRFIPVALEKLRETDVLLGHHRGASRLPGNKHYRSLVSRYSSVYEQANHGDKSGVAFKVVQTIARACPSGRFVEKDSQGTMKTVSPERANRIICNAFNNKNRQKREKSLLVAGEEEQEEEGSALGNIQTSLVAEEVVNLNLGEFDVLLGRGHGVSSLRGNTNYVAILRSFRAEYSRAERVKKREVAMKVVETIRRANGRFVKRDEGDKLLTVSPGEVLGKVCHGLRELKTLAPPKDIYKTLSDNGVRLENSMSIQSARLSSQGQHSVKAAGEGASGSLKRHRDDYEDEESSPCLIPKKIRD